METSKNNETDVPEAVSDIVPDAVSNAVPDGAVAAPDRAAVAPDGAAASDAHAGEAEAPEAAKAPAQRVWELDAFRGLCILGMVAVHSVYDMTELFGAPFKTPAFYDYIKDYGGILFIVLSGLCATFGHHSVRRGLTVLSFGALISLVMAALTHFFPGDFNENMNIYFGILHLLGCCMLLYPLFKRLPLWALALFSAASLALGLYIEGIAAPVEALGVLGFRMKPSADYFPLFPNLAYFLLGTILGRTLYRKKRSLLPASWGENAAARFLRLCGRRSLWIYVLHQPVVYGALWLIYRAL